MGMQTVTARMASLNILGKGSLGMCSSTKETGPLRPILRPERACCFFGIQQKDYVLRARWQASRRKSRRPSNRTPTRALLRTGSSVTSKRKNCAHKRKSSAWIRKRYCYLALPPSHNRAEMRGENFAKLHKLTKKLTGGGSVRTKKRPSHVQPARSNIT